jgi:hypothetical protein
MPSASQWVPVVSMPPPAPSIEARLRALESSAKWRTVHESRLKMAPSGVWLGSGTARKRVLYHMPAPSMVMPVASRPPVVWM